MFITSIACVSGEEKGSLLSCWRVFVELFLFWIKNLKDEGPNYTCHFKSFKYPDKIQSEISDDDDDYQVLDSQASLKSLQFVHANGSTGCLEINLSISEMVSSKVK